MESIKLELRYYRSRVASMANLEFAQFFYFPCFQCSEPEQIAYQNLDELDKASVLPIIELGQIKYEASLEEAVDAVSEMMEDRPFVLDLSKDRAPAAYVAKNNPDSTKIAKVQKSQDAYNQELTKLLSPADGFENWRSLVAQFPHAIPVLQFTDPEAQAKSVLRQAAMFAKAGFGSLAIRIDQEISETIFPVIGQIAAVLDSASQLFVIVDCGQGRTRISERAEFAKLTISRVMEELEPAQALQLSAVCLSDSFTTPQEGQPKVYESMSWALWEQACEKFPFLFGDYVANYRFKKTTTFMPGDWRAQVVYALPDSWLVYKHPNAQDPSGWIEGSKAVLNHDECDNANACWGSEVLSRAANGDIKDVSSARFWHGAKINMHIHRQIRVAEERLTGP